VVVDLVLRERTRAWGDASAARRHGKRYAFTPGGAMPARRWAGWRIPCRRN